MKRLSVDPQEQIKSEVEQHSTVEKRKTTRSKTAKRKQHIELIKRLFPKAKRVLCIGCRDNSEVQDFIDAGFKARGIDVANGSKYITKMDAHDIAKVFKKNEFDIVYASHVLEHLYDPNSVMSDIRKIAKLGIFIALPHGKRSKGPNPTDLNINHPTIYDIMEIAATDKRQLHAKGALSDFSPFGEFKVTHYMLAKKELELILRFV